MTTDFKQNDPIQAQLPVEELINELVPVVLAFKQMNPNISTAELISRVLEPVIHLMFKELLQITDPDELKQFERELTPIIENNSFFVDGPSSIN